MPKTKDKWTIYAPRQEGEDPEQVRAKVVLAPTLGASAALQQWVHVDPVPDLTALSDELRWQCEAISSGNLTRAEAMLTAQAHLLDQIFNRLAARAIDTEYLSRMEAYLKLAMRAQRQCAQTWESISAIQNPPTTTFVRQANVAHNQQINNGSRAQETEKPPTQLLEHTDGNRLEFGTTGETSRGDQAMETMEAVNRTEDSGG